MKARFGHFLPPGPQLANEALNRRNLSRAWPKTGRGNVFFLLILIRHLPHLPSGIWPIRLPARLLHNRFRFDLSNSC